ncbi:MAG: hypothetical protein ABIO40_06895 [Devosia sp.]
MPSEVEKFIKIENLQAAPGQAKGQWHTIPNGFRVRVWEMSMADAVAGDSDASDSSGKRFIFHIGHLPHVARGSRVTYLGTKLSVLSVSDSTRLLGLELRCGPLT